MPSELVAALRDAVTDVPAYCRPQGRPGPELITVIIPVLNEERHIAETLAALSRQTWRGDWEVVVVDNGCTDATAEHRSLVGRAAPLADDRGRLIARGLNHARNVGVAAARGDYLAFCDGDNVPAPGWLDALAEVALDADLIGGSLEVETLNDPLTLAWMDEGAVRELPTGGHGYLPFVPGGNCGLWASIARELRWDERFSSGPRQGVRLACPARLVPARPRAGRGDAAPLPSSLRALAWQQYRTAARIRSSTAGSAAAACAARRCASRSLRGGASPAASRRRS